MRERRQLEQRRVRRIQEDEQTPIVVIQEGDAQVEAWGVDGGDEEDLSVLVKSQDEVPQTQPASGSRTRKLPNRCRIEFDQEDAVLSQQVATKKLSPQVTVDIDTGDGCSVEDLDIVNSQVSNSNNTNAQINWLDHHYSVIEIADYSVEDDNASVSPTLFSEADSDSEDTTFSAITDESEDTVSSLSMDDSEETVSSSSTVSLSTSESAEAETTSQSSSSTTTATTEEIQIDDLSSHTSLS